MLVPLLCHQMVDGLYLLHMTALYVSGPWSTPPYKCMLLHESEVSSIDSSPTDNIHFLSSGPNLDSPSLAASHLWLSSFCFILFWEFPQCSLDYYLGTLPLRVKVHHGSL